MFKITRRGFLVGCSAAIAAMRGGVSFAAFDDPAVEPNQEILVVLSLRGGCDGLSVVSPIAGSDRARYEEYRPTLRIATSGAKAALPLDERFGLHPAAAPLYDLYQAGQLAIVHAAGLTSGTRSHFDAMKYMELGTPGSRSATTGWLARHLQTAHPAGGKNLAPNLAPALAIGTNPPDSLLGNHEAIGMDRPDDLLFPGKQSSIATQQRDTLRRMYAGDSLIHRAGLRTLDAADILEKTPTTYTPANGALYPDTEIGRHLMAVAQVIRLQLGLRVATVDFGGWDTHEHQGEEGAGYFAARLADLSAALAAFYADLSGSEGTDYTRRLTVVMLSEFGRKVAENGSKGTDHGHGNVMLLLGGSVNGGRVHGQWPGLEREQLYFGSDLEITTDYRRVLGEVLIRRLGNPNLGVVFPGYEGYAPLDVVQGVDLTPVV